jgi:hypothetical protein
MVTDLATTRPAGLRRRWRRVVILFGAAALVSGGVAAWAAIPSSPAGVFTACVSTAAATKGALRVIDAQAGETCKTTEKTVTWNQRGINWRGAWSNTTAYTAHDAVAYQGSSYIATKSNTGVVPTTIANWAVLARAGAPAVPHVSFGQTSSATSLPEYGGMVGQRTPTGFDVPAGRYLIEWHATIVDFGPSGTSDVFRCAVESDDGSKVGGAATQLNSSPGQSVQTIGNQSVVTYASSNFVTLECWHDQNLPPGNYYLDPGVTLSATLIA